MNGTPKCRLMLIEAAGGYVPSARHSRTAAESSLYDLSGPMAFLEICYALLPST